MIPATPATVYAAKQFLAKKWRERAAEMGRQPPQSLAGACKFAALFAREVFGAKIAGNWHHTFTVKNGTVIDLTDGAGVPMGVDPYRQDPEFVRDPAFRWSLRTCHPRVSLWVAEFLQLQGE